MSDPQALHTELLGDVEIQRDRLPSWYRLEGVPLADALTAVLELHKPAAADLWSSAGKRQGWQCEECASRCHSGSGLNCDEPLDAEYPCETVKVIASALGVVADG